MRGYIILLVVAIVAVDTVRSQVPPTRTRKGPPPSRRRGDNPDVGMPSGKDVPDGRRVVPGAAPPAGAAPPPPAGNPPPPAGRMPPTQTRSMGRRPAPAAAAPAPPAAPPAGGAPPPPRAGGMPPTQTRSRKGRPGRRFNDNPDFGLPSGADYPDSRRWAPAYQVPMANPVPPAFAPFYAPPAFAPSCEYKCMNQFNLVCSTTGNTYNSDCELQCNYEEKACNGECPCNQGVPFLPPVVLGCGCSSEWSPVCVDEEQTYRNECTANCDGKYKYTCDGACPCPK